MSHLSIDLLPVDETGTVPFGDPATLALLPAQRFAVPTCMNARLDLASDAGMTAGRTR